MPSLLTQKLADHLDLTEEEADRQLTDFIAQLKKRLDDQGQAVISGVGTFRTGDKGLVFEPDDALARAINHRFVGLEPVKVDVAQEIPDYGKNELFRSEEPDEEEPVESSEAAPEEKSEASPDLPPDAPSTAAETSSPPAPEEEKEEEAAAPDEPGEEHPEPDAPAPSPQQQETVPEPPAADDDKPGEAAADEAAAAHAAEIAAQKTSPPEEKEKEPPPSQEPEGSAFPEDDHPATREVVPDDTPRRTSRRPAIDRTRKTTWPWILVLLIFILSAGGLWYVLQPTPQTDSPSPPVAQEEQPATPPAENGSESAPDPTSPSANEATGSPGAPAYEAPDPLDPSAGGWTIVLASETSREAAQATLRSYAEKLRGEDLAFGIMQDEVEGTTRFRVGAGQFASADEARAAMNRLTDSLPEGAWLLQIESDSQTN